MNLAIVIRHFYPFKRPSGVISFTRELVKEFETKNIKVSVICIKKEGEQDFYSYNKIDIYKYNQFDFLKYRSILKKINPDQTLIVSSMPSTLKMLLWLGVLWPFTCVENVSLYQATNFSKLAKNPLLTYLLQKFNNVFSANHTIKKGLEENYKVKSKVIFPGTKLIKKSSPRSLGAKTHKKVGFFGHITPVKGIDVFLKLPELLPSITFYLVAGFSKTEKSKKFEQMILKKAKRLRNVKSFGFIKNPLKIMAKCDILVLPYRHSKMILGVAQSAIEAMAMGIPVIGTKSPALEPLIQNNVNGFITKASASEIKEKIKLLLKDEKLYNDFSRNSQTIVKNKFSISKTADKFIDNLK